MAAGLTETISIEANKAFISDWEGQLLKLTMSHRALQKYSSNEITAIKQKFAPQKEEIRNKIKNLDSQNASTEYQQLMSELNELENQESQAISIKETEASDREEDFKVQQDQLETLIEAAKKDTESMEELRKENIEKSFGYFK